MANIVIYTKDYCPYCKKAKTLLDIKKAKYTEIDVTNDAALQDEAKQKSGGGSSVPQIFINDKHIGGCDDMYRLNEKGELDKLLAG